MRFYKLRVTPNAAGIATAFNEQFKPENIPEQNDPYSVDWIYSSDQPYYVGEEALRIADPERMGYVTRWPIYGGNFNTRDYPSMQLIYSDVETIFREALKQKGIEASAYKVGTWSGILVTALICAYVGLLCRTRNSRLLRSSVRGSTRADPLARHGVQAVLCPASTDTFSAVIFIRSRMHAGIFSVDIWCRYFKRLCGRYGCGKDQHRLRR